MKRYKQFMSQIKEASRRNPVEVILSVLFCITGCLHYEDILSVKSMLIYFPVFFMLCYTLNILTENNKYRWLYFASGLFFVPFIWMDCTLFSATYTISLVLVILIYLASSCKKDNLQFVRNGLLYVQALLSAWLLSGVAWLLSITIYYSIQYIFEIFKAEDSRFIAYASFVAFMVILPLLFLVFIQNKEAKFEANKLFNILFNVVLSPALLTYALILYLYFIKIAILWSLPKGAVAYIVVYFVSSAFILKGCQPLLKQRYYDWFYNRVGLFVIPALLMYWIGAVYRIREYGFTELRVYLVLLGIFLSVCALLFFSKRWGRYLYMAYFAIALFGLFTYIPGVSASDLGALSQKKRGVQPEKKKVEPYYTALLGLDNVDVVGYNTLYKVYNYHNMKDTSYYYASMRNDSLFVRDPKGNLLLGVNALEFWNGQLQKAGLSTQTNHTRQTLKEHAAQLLRYETDSTAFILSKITITTDSVPEVFDMEVAYYLK